MKGTTKFWIITATSEENQKGLFRKKGGYLQRKRAEDLAIQLRGNIANAYSYIILEAHKEEIDEHGFINIEIHRLADY